MISVTGEVLGRLAGRLRAATAGLSRRLGRPPVLRCDDEAVWERRRGLERKLHDGPALRLSALSLELAAVAEQAPACRERVARAQDEVATILDELREIGGMIFPPLLTGGDVGPALRAMAERRRLALTVDVRTPGLSASTAAAVYFAVTDMLESADGDSSVAVRVERHRRMVMVAMTVRRAASAPGTERRVLIPCA